jgi:heptosyltransferase-2
VSGRRLEIGSESGYRRQAAGCGDTESMATQVRPALLVAQTSFLGDVVLTTPLLTALRARLRPHRLAVLVRPEAAPLLEGHPDVDAVLVDDKRGTDAGPGGIVRVARRLRREAFDLVVSPHRSLRTAILLAAAGIPRRVGFADSRGAVLFHARVPRDRRRHDVERNLALLEPFGGSSDPPRLHVPVHAAAVARVAGLLPEGRGPLIGLAPGSAWATKRWHPDGFAGVLRAVRDQGARVVVLGASGERAIAEDVVRRAGGGATVLAGRTDLATLVAIIDRLALLVANDSAPMHIACARETPVVAVFCATTPALGYGPWGPRSAIVQADLACRPCARHGGLRCPRGTEDCMRLVRADAVLAAARALLATARTAGSAA